MASFAPSNPRSQHRSDSPVRGCNFPNSNINNRLLKSSVKMEQEEEDDDSCSETRTITTSFSHYTTCVTTEQSLRPSGATGQSRSVVWSNGPTKFQHGPTVNDRFREFPATLVVRRKPAKGAEHGEKEHRVQLGSGGSFNVSMEGGPTARGVETVWDYEQEEGGAEFGTGPRVSCEDDNTGIHRGRMVKWLKRIIVTTKESENYYHFKDNRVLPSHVDAELANAEAWWYKPEYIINELNINSVITTPCHEEILPINSWTTQRPYTLRGYSYSGGGKKVTRVEVTMDGGETWQVCTLDHPEKPNKYGKYWCWCFWSLEVEVLDLLGAKEIAVRAWDETLNTQPEKLIWNLMGMMNNCWFTVKTNVCKPHKGEIGIIFEHPTVPGNQSGGWMDRERHLEISTESNQTLKKSISTPFMNTASNTYSLSEVKKHNSPQSAWIIVHGHVYDCTRFLKDHPGALRQYLNQRRHRLHRRVRRHSLGQSEENARGLPNRRVDHHRLRFRLLLQLP
ncbi:hypothetical protein Csa_018786 [Cucumis sativus]|nr:hypothetical protein Csa_018786 [Cucumis sativus]